MIAQKNRFHGPHAIRKLKGSNFQANVISARACKCSGSNNDYRLAVVVSKKVAAKAVDRNKIRRRIFEAVRQQKRLSGLPIDCIIYVKDASVGSIPSSQLSEEIAMLTKKVIARVLH